MNLVKDYKDFQVKVLVEFFNVERLTLMILLRLD